MPALPNPLLLLHQQADAEFQAYAELEIVSTFNEPQAEYAAIHKSAGVMDMPQRGVMELTGKDRLAFLNNLLTNQTWDKESKTGMGAGRVVYAFFLNTKGRVVADMNVVELGERTIVEADTRLVELLIGEFGKYLFAEQVGMTSLLGQFHRMSVFGPGAAEALRIEAMGAMEGRSVEILGTPVVVFRDDVCGVAGYHLVVPLGAVEAVWGGLSGVRRVGWAAFNATRIEAGRALFGVDFDDSVLPAETGELERGVSFTKGCYLGQEIVARMHARGQVARQVVGIRMEEDALPIAGTIIYDEQDNQIGGITSSTISPMLSGAAICLGLVKKPWFAVGSKVRVPAEGAFRVGRVVERPFVKG